MSITGADVVTPPLLAPALSLPCSDLNQLLRGRAERTPEQLAYHFPRNGDEPGDALTYAMLDRGARARAAHLLRHGRAGDRVLLFPGGAAFLVAFFGCLYARMIAVCVDLPRAGRPMTRLLPILREAAPRLALGPDSLAADRPDLDALLREAGCTLLAGGGADAPLPAADVPLPGPDALAWLQYTSGSVSEPKGVMVSHGNALATLCDIDRASRHGPDSCMVSWLPVFHDMGLLYGVLQPLYNGFPCHQLAPMTFLQQPMRWLRAITHFGATHTAAPNFAFQLCVDTADPRRTAGLDLHTLKVAINGAEPVRDDVVRRFVETFAPFGLGPDVVCPGYGLAETALKVATHPRGAPLRRFAIDPAALARGRVAARSEADGGRVLLGHGASCIDARVEIVDPRTLRPCAPDQVGEIWVAGAAVAQGYWQRPQETAETFGARLADSGDGPFLRTGDLGFVADGDLFVTGRLKDVIIIHGRNHYPQDLERTAQASHAALRIDHGAAFSIDAADGEQLVIVQEVRRSHLRDLDPAQATDSIRRAIAELHDVGNARIVLIAPGTITKTTSGKIQRAACRAAYLAGTLAQVHASGRPYQAPADGAHLE